MKKVLLLLLLAGCAAPPAGFRPLILRRVSIPPPSMEVEKIDAPTLRFEAVTRFEAAIPWEYGPGASNYCWTLQTSTDLVLWVDIPSGCLTGVLYAGATNAARFFRLKGSAQ